MIYAVMRNIKQKPIFSIEFYVGAIVLVTISVNMYEQKRRSHDMFCHIDGLPLKRVGDLGLSKNFILSRVVHHLQNIATY